MIRAKSGTRADMKPASANRERFDGAPRQQLTNISMDEPVDYAKVAELRGPVDSLQKAIAVRASLEAGNGVLKTARERGVGTSVVQRIKAELRGDAHI